jgi:hypothetical protein
MGPCHCRGSHPTFKITDDVDFTDFLVRSSKAKAVFGAARLA